MSTIVQFLAENKVASTVALAGTLVVLTASASNMRKKIKPAAAAAASDHHGPVTLERVPAHTCLRLAYLAHGGAVDHAKVRDGEVRVAGPEGTLGVRRGLKFKKRLGSLVPVPSS